MDDSYFDRTIVCKRNLDCIFSLTGEKYYFHKLTFSALEQMTDFS